jgi:hypothetical protein
MHKFRTKDQNEKNSQLRCWKLSLVGVKLYEIKSLAIMGAIKMKLKKYGLNQNLSIPN